MSLKLLERQQRKKEELEQTAKRVVGVGSNPSSSRGPSQQSQPQQPQQQPRQQPQPQPQPQYDPYGREIRAPSNTNPRSYAAEPSYSGRSQPTYRPRQYDPSPPPPPPQPRSSYGSPSRSYDYPPRTQPEPYYRAPPSSVRAPYAPQPFGESPSLRPSASSASAPPPPLSASSSSTSDLGSGGSLAAWSRPALESRVLTLERLLAESAARPASSASSAPLSSQVTDRELSDHLTVTVRKNRELRAELETCRASLTNLLAEREALLNKLNSDNDALQQLLEEAQRGKEALSKCISQLSMEKLELKHQLEHALEYVEQTRENGSGAANAAPVMYEELSSSVDEVSVINQGLRESMQAMKLKEEQEARNNSSRLNISAISTNRMFDDDDEDDE